MVKKFDVPKNLRKRPEKLSITNRTSPTYVSSTSIQLDLAEHHFSFFFFWPYSLFGYANGNEEHAKTWFSLVEVEIFHVSLVYSAAWHRLVPVYVWWNVSITPVCPLHDLCYL